MKRDVCPNCMVHTEPECITDEQRREVAAELRRQAAYGDGNLGEWWQRLQNIALGEVDFPKPEQLFELLADLIDRPTCCAIQLCPVAFYECSECGYDGWVDAASVTRFCPNCGAEVVR